LYEDTIPDVIFDSLPPLSTCSDVSLDSLAPPLPISVDALLEILTNLTGGRLSIVSDKTDVADLGSTHLLQLSFLPSLRDRLR
jgi:hypothetical protein